MAKIKFDPNAAFKNIVGVGQEEPPASVQAAEEKHKPPKAEIPKEPHTEISKPTNDILVQKAYYITVNQYRELKLRAALGDEKDMSAIVRAALDAYFADTNKKNRK